MLPVHHVPSGPFGVVLNSNAGRMKPRLARQIERVAGRDHVFLTESPEHAREVLHRCVEREYTTVFAGGGDGTVIDAINTLHSLRAAGERVPGVGVLRLGTGNALARYLGSGRPLKAIGDYAAGRVHKAVPIRMVESNGTLFPFGGMGTDAAILNDYVALRRSHAQGPLARLFKGLSGYILAGLGRTVPNYLRRPNPRVTITNLGRPAYRIGPDGEEIGDPIPTGGVLYEGTAAMLGPATTPIIGYGIRFFPFADRRAGRFQLRLIDMSPLESVWNFPAAAMGTLAHAGCHDFYVDRVRVVSEQALPYQIGGDARGYTDEVTWGISSVPVTLVGRA